LCIDDNLFVWVVICWIVVYEEVNSVCLGGVMCVCVCVEAWSDHLFHFVLDVFGSNFLLSVSSSSPYKLFPICNIIILYIPSLVGLWICCLFFFTHLNGDYLCFFSTTIDCTLIFKRLYVHKFPSSELLPPLVPPKDDRCNGLFMDKEFNIAKGCFFHLDCLVFPFMVFFFSLSPS
jgi:hypothetical protein